MKILFISNIFAPHVRGGYEIGCLELAEKYTELGHSVVVATSENTPELSKYSDPTHMDVRRIFSPVKYYDESYNYHFQSNIFYFYEKVLAFGGYVEANCIALRRLMEQEKPDLVWIFNLLGLGPVGILDTVISFQTKVLVHLMEHIDGVILDYNRLFNLTSKWRYLKSQVTAISCSKKILESNRLLGKYQDNEVVYNWVNMTKDGRQVLDLEVSANFFEDNRNELFRIVYFGQIAEKKGLLFLLDVAKKISKSKYKDEIVIDIYGKGEKNFLKSLHNQIDGDSNLSKVFVLQGFLSKEKLLDRLSQYNLSIFLLSDDEPFAYAPMEAALKKVPVMLTTGACEILKNEYDAIFIDDRKDTNQIYRKIISCLENEKKLEEIKKNAVKTLQTYCDLDKVTVPKLNSIIEELPTQRGYSFEHILNTCEILKYPYFELGITHHLSGARYKFIDKLVHYIYNFPVIGDNLKIMIKWLASVYKRWK